MFLYYIEKKKNINSYSLSEKQVIAILELRLQRLTAYRINEIETEVKKLATLISELKKILSSKKILLNVISEELIIDSPFTFSDISLINFK